MAYSASTTRPKLSPAQRTMLHNAVHGRPLGTSLTRNSTSHKTQSTVQALHRAGMLVGIDHKPTTAGRAYFETPKPLAQTTISVSVYETSSYIHSPGCDQ